jgi:hypothetical protein
MDDLAQTQRFFAIVFFVVLAHGAHPSTILPKAKESGLAIPPPLGH